MRQNINVKCYKVDYSKFVKDPTIPPVFDGFGEISLLIHNTTKKKYFVKKLNTAINNEKNHLLLNHKIRILSSFLHPAIVSFYGYFIDKNKYPYFFFEGVEGGTLSFLIQNRNVLTNTQKYIISYGIALAIQYLHQNECYHQDLKAENILLDKELRPYITYFGKKQNYKTNQNFIKYDAPEVQRGIYNSPSIDVYSYGVILYELWTENSNPVQSPISISKMAFMIKYVPGSWQKLIEDCLSQDPKKRPTFDEIVMLIRSPVFTTKDMDSQKITNYNNFLKDKNPLLSAQILVSKTTYKKSRKLEELRTNASTDNLNDIFLYVVVQSIAKYGQTDHYEVYDFSKKYLKEVYKNPKYFSSTDSIKKIATIELCLGKSLAALGHYILSNNLLRRSLYHGEPMAAYYLAELMSCNLIKQKKKNEMNELYKYAESKGVKFVLNDQVMLVRKFVNSSRLDCFENNELIVNIFGPTCENVLSRYQNIPVSLDPKNVINLVNNQKMIKLGLLRAFHATTNLAAEGIIFDKSLKKGSVGMFGGGIYFAADKSTAKYKCPLKSVAEAYVECVVDFGNALILEKPNNSITLDFLQKCGCDSVMGRRTEGTDWEFVVYDSKRVWPMKITLLKQS